MALGDKRPQYYFKAHTIFINIKEYGSLTTQLSEVNTKVTATVSSCTECNMENVCMHFSSMLQLSLPFKCDINILLN